VTGWGNAIAAFYALLCDGKCLSGNIERPFTGLMTGISRNLISDGAIAFTIFAKSDGCPINVAGGCPRAFGWCAYSYCASFGI